MTVYTYFDYKGNSAEILKDCLKDFLGYDTEVICRNGKPYVSEDNLFVSLSHTSHYMVVAIGYKSVGIDIEIIKERNYYNIAKRLFGNKEIKDLNDFYREWTVYEAGFKEGNNTDKYKYFDIIGNCACAICSEDTDCIFIPYEIINKGGI